jgi:hypothetical protein
VIRRILLALVVLAVALAALIASRPAAFRLERSTVVAAPPAAVFAQLNDFRRWQAWSPWEHADPSMERTYGGAPSGVGATYAWKGNDDVGAGRMTIVESRPNERVGIRLEFLEPMRVTNDVVFRLEPAPDGVRVTWTMSGEHGFFGKAFTLVADMDALVGAQFEHGLAALKSAAES